MDSTPSPSVGCSRPCIKLLYHVSICLTLKDSACLCWRDVYSTSCSRTWVVSPRSPSTWTRIKYNASSVGRLYIQPHFKDYAPSVGRLSTQPHGKGSASFLLACCLLSIVFKDSGHLGDNLSTWPHVQGPCSSLLARHVYGIAFKRLCSTSHGDLSTWNASLPPSFLLDETPCHTCLWAAYLTCCSSTLSCQH